MKRNILISLFLLLQICCKEEVKNITSLICFENPPNRSEYLSSVFKSFKIVRLETTDESLIGNPVMKIKKTKDAYYIAYGFRYLLKFDHEGKFLKKIGCLGQGPGEYVQLNNYDVRDDNGDILILDIAKVHVYDSNGTFKSTIPLKIRGFNIKSIDSSAFLIADTNADFEYNIYLCDYNGKVLNKYINKHNLQLIWNWAAFTHWKEDHILYHLDFSNSFVCYDKITGKFSDINLLCNQEILTREKELELKKLYNQTDDKFQYVENPELNLIQIINSYSDYLYFNIGNQSKGYNYNYIVDKNYNVKYFYTDKTINDISFSKGLRFLCTEASDCFITYEYIYEIFESMEQQQEKFKDNQHFVTLYKELSEIKNRDDENLVLIELKIE